MYKFLKGFLNFIVQIIYPYKLYGKEKIVKGRRAFWVGNHYRLMGYHSYGLHDQRPGALYLPNRNCSTKS